MDDIRIYDRILDSGEIANVYNWSPFGGGGGGGAGGGEPPVEPETNTVQKAALRGNQTWRGNIRIR